MRQRWPAAAASFAVLAAGLSVLVVAGSGGRASANPTGASPQVFVGGPGTSPAYGPYDQFNLSSLQAGGAGPVASATFGAPVAAVAVNTTATKVVYGLLAPPSAVAALPPAIAVEDVASRAVTRVTTPGASPVGIAVDPTNPSRAYVLQNTGNAGRVDTVGIATTPPTDAVLASSTGRVTVPAAIAISPDGLTLFVSGAAGSTPDLTGITVANTTQTAPWFFSGHGGSIVDIAVAPAGNALYAVSTGSNPTTGAADNWVLALPLPLTSAAKPLWTVSLPPAGSPLNYPKAVTVGPDGSTVYVAGTSGTGSAVQAFAASSGAPGAVQALPITPGDGFGGAASEAVSPDGATVVVAGTDSAGQNHVDALPLPSLAAVNDTLIGTGFGHLAGPQELAITPDQAPVASFSAIPGASGTPTSFDAGASTVAYGSVNNFTWDFGDGHGATTGTSLTSHIYATPGTYTVTLTETDAAGTSLPPAVFLTAYSVNGPGQTPYRRADASARTSRKVVVTAPGSTPTTVVPVPGTPTLTLNPAVGPPGTLVTVTGSGFPANTPITVSWSVSTGSVVITSDAGGNLPPTILPVLVPDVLGPRFAASATNPPAQAPFLVVPSSAKPGGQQGSYLFRTEGP